MKRTQYQKITVFVTAVFLAVALSSAAVLSSFGVISGTASVQSSVVIEGYDLDEDDKLESVNLANGLERDIEMAEYDFQVNGESLVDQELNTGLNENVMLEEAYNVASGEVLALSIDGNIVDNETEVDLNE